MVDAFGVGHGQGSEGGSPAMDDRALDESGAAGRLLAGRPFSLARARARLSSMSRMVSHNSLIVSAAALDDRAVVGRRR